MSQLQIVCDYLTGDRTSVEIEDLYEKLQQGLIHILYRTVEQFVNNQRLSKGLNQLYSWNKFALLVIDECHCITEWGPDFRTDYYELQSVRKRFEKVPCMALTATADIRTQINVFDKLALTTSTYFIGDLNRPNLKVIVKYNIGKKVTIQLITKNRIENKDVPAIVFCTTKKHAEMLAKLLEEESVTAKPYHSGIDKGTLDEIQKDWMENKIPTVCATIGFGMGVDEENVGFVFHYGLPDSLRSYLQQIGRAGRDHKKAVCILFYKYGDLVKKDFNE